MNGKFGYKEIRKQIEDYPAAVEFNLHAIEQAFKDGRINDAEKVELFDFLSSGGKECFGDLHTHTAHSREADNFMNIRLQDYAEAKKKMPGLKIVGVVDHDTMNHLEPMYRTEKAFRSGELPLLLPGIEISCAFHHPGNESKLVPTHILGYFPHLMKGDEQKLREINAVLENAMRRVHIGKLKKNVDIRLAYYFSNKIIPEKYNFEDLKSKVLRQYEKDKELFELKEPKAGDIINWPLNSSDKIVTDVLLEEGILKNREEGKIYVDRFKEENIPKLAKILQEKENISEYEATEKAKRLVSSCHGDYNDDFDMITTQEAIFLIRVARGIPILAHPMVSFKKFDGGMQSFFEYCKKELIPTGLQGMEAFYPKQQKFTEDIIRFCEQNNLLITGGSDDHQDGRGGIGKEGSRCPVKYIERMLGMRL